jgi:hypothetical protein
MHLQKVPLPSVRMKVQNTHTPLNDLFNWLVVSIRSGTGPLDPMTKERTCIAAICLQDDPDFLHRLISPTVKDNGERQSAQGGIYCITMQGQILASDTSLLGIHTSCCTWGEQVIGVTLVQGTWQLWKWMPLQKTAHTLVETSSPDILRITLLLPTEQKRGSDPWFWCVEEYPSGIRVLQRACSTLREVQSTWCEGSHFLNMGNAAIIYDWSAQGVTAYEQSLFLLVRDRDEQLQLLKVE